MEFFSPAVLLFYFRKGWEVKTVHSVHPTQAFFRMMRAALLLGFGGLGFLPFDKNLPLKCVSSMVMFLFPVFQVIEVYDLTKVKLKYW